jgi:hypothetical protein
MPKLILEREPRLRSERMPDWADMSLLLDSRRSVMAGGKNPYFGYNGSILPAHPEPVLFSASTFRLAIDGPFQN